MLIEEIVRTCANERVAEAALSCIGETFLSEVRDRARTYDMSVGAFTALSIQHFIRHGDEGELRSVVSAMANSQEPILAGLHRILCTMLASGGVSDAQRKRDRVPRLTAQLCAIEADRRRDLRI